MPSAVPGLVRICLESIVGEVVPTPLWVRGDFRKPKIQNLREATARDENVGGFDIAVNDPSGVSGIKRIGDLDAHIEHGLDFHRFAGDPMAEGLTLQ